MENKKYTELVDNELNEVNGGFTYRKDAALQSPAANGVIIVTEAQTSEAHRASIRERANDEAKSIGPLSINRRLHSPGIGGIASPTISKSLDARRIVVLRDRDEK